MGSHMLRNQLRSQGVQVNRKRVPRLIQLTDLRAIYRRRNTCKRHPVTPCSRICCSASSSTSPTQVGAADRTYIPMARGFVYLFADMAWYSRKALAWSVRNTLSADLCIEAVQEAIVRFGPPQIFNTDHGSQFTGGQFRILLTSYGIRVGMYGRSCWRDTMFVERLCRLVKYEEIYLHAYQSPSEATAAIGRYFAFYNTRRSHTALDRRTPGHAHFKSLQPPPLAKPA